MKLSIIKGALGLAFSVVLLSANAQTKVVWKVVYMDGSVQAQEYLSLESCMMTAKIIPGATCIAIQKN